MAGRSTPGSIFSTKCAVAINAPVLPALTQAMRIIAPSPDRSRRPAMSLSAPQGLARMIVHLDDVGRKQAGHVGRECAAQLALQVGLPSDQGKPHVAEFMGCRHPPRPAPTDTEGPRSPLMASMAI